MERFLVAHALRRLGIHAARVGWLVPPEHTPSGGYSVTVRLRDGADPSTIEREAAKLAVILDAAEVIIIRTAPRVLLLSARPPMAAGFPPYPAQRVHHLVQPAPAIAPLGLDASGYPVGLRIFDAAGGTVSLIAGSPGVGKSCALALVLAAYVETAAHIVWFDPKGGADAGLYASRVQAIPDAIDASAALRELSDLNKLVQQRAQALGTGLSLAALPPVLVFVDEWSALGANGSKPDRDRVQDELRRLVATARAAHVSVILATQRPTSATVDVATRSLATTRVCFAVGDPQGSIAALGVSGAEKLSPQRDRGRALLDVGYGPELVRLYALPRGLPELANANAGRRQTTALVLSWDAASFREQRALWRNPLA